MTNYLCFLPVQCCHSYNELISSKIHQQKGMVITLRQFSLNKTMRTYFPKILFNIVLSSTSCTSSDLVPLDYMIKISCVYFLYPHPFLMHSPTHVLDLITESFFFCNFPMCQWINLFSSHMFFPEGFPSTIPYASFIFLCPSQPPR